ncbi:MAG TPA: DUF362 domain-containing protein, partial [Propionibacteriaceae bacterium]|nr:DUF362 domain-containing protein [Propionibacteriaceae bacterium]
MAGPHVYVISRRDDASLEDDIREALDKLPAPVAPGQVLLKPNMLREAHILRDGEHEQVITQPEVLVPVARWARQRLCPNHLVLADAPEASADIGLVMERNGVRAIFEDPEVAPDRFEDLRLVRYVQKDGVPTDRIPLPGDSRGTVRVAVHGHSAFVTHDQHRYYGADYDITETNIHHRGDVHEYMFSGTALESDLVINLPKMKSHKKAGVTLSLKNLVGLNGNKNWLPHHSIGTPRQGGDAYRGDDRKARLESVLLNRIKPLVKDNKLASTLFSSFKRGGAQVFGDTQETVRSGNWHGNDTIWRMILDLNRILVYGTVQGTLASTPQRAAWSVVDGIVAGDGNGPEAPDRVDAGLVVVGDSFAAVDLVCTRLMGFDW